jgi:hypothetical protein
MAFRTIDSMQHSSFDDPYLWPMQKLKLYEMPIGWRMAMTLPVYKAAKRVRPGRFGGIGPAW